MLTSQQRDLLNTRCDVVVSSRNDRLVPSVCWGMGGHVDDDGRRATVWLRRDQARPIVADVRANACLAAVFCVPHTSVALQVKGEDARVRAATELDAQRLQAHVDNLVREIELVQLNETFTRTLFEQPLEELVAIEFTVTSVYEQTPGPGAGHAIGGHA